MAAAGLQYVFLHVLTELAVPCRAGFLIGGEHERQIFNHGALVIALPDICAHDHSGVQGPGDDLLEIGGVVAQHGAVINVAGHGAAGTLFQQLLKFFKTFLCGVGDGVLVGNLNYDLFGGRTGI